MEEQNKILVFKLENQQFGLSLASVERILRASNITPIADSPAFVAGVIDYFGEVLAVIDLRQRLSLESSKLKLSDRFIVVQTSKRKLVLIVDEIIEIASPDPLEFIDAQAIDAGLKFVKVMSNGSGIIFIYDVESMLSNDEDMLLDTIIQKLDLQPNNE